MKDGSCFNSSFGGASIEGNMVEKDGVGRFSNEIFQGGCLKYEDSSKVLTSSMDFSTSNSSKLKWAKHAYKGLFDNIYGRACSIISSDIYKKTIFFFISL